MMQQYTFLECEKSSRFFYDFPIGYQSSSVLLSPAPNFNLQVALRPVPPIRLGNDTSDHLDIPRPNVEISEDRLALYTKSFIVD